MSTKVCNRASPTFCHNTQYVFTKKLEDEKMACSDGKAIKSPADLSDTTDSAEQGLSSLSYESEEEQELAEHPVKPVDSLFETLHSENGLLRITEEDNTPSVNRSDNTGEAVAGLQTELKLSSQFLMDARRDLDLKNANMAMTSDLRERLSCVVEINVRLADLKALQQVRPSSAYWFSAIYLSCDTYNTQARNSTVDHSHQMQWFIRSRVHSMTLFATYYDILSMCLKLIYSSYSFICIVHTAIQLWPVKSLEKSAAHSLITDSQSFLEWLAIQMRAKCKGYINMNYRPCWRLLIWMLPVRWWCYLVCFISRGGPRISWKNVNHGRANTQDWKKGSLHANFKLVHWRFPCCLVNFHATGYVWNCKSKCCLLGCRMLRSGITNQP